MTDYEKKLFELKNLNADIDTFESADNSLVIQYFINSYICTEFIYSLEGKFLEQHEINAYPQP